MSFFIRAASLDASKLREQSGLAAAHWKALPCIVGSSSHAIGQVENDAAPRIPPALEFAHALARSFGVAGPVLLTSSACTSGLTAVQLALDLLEVGAFAQALVLGAELPNRLTAAGFRSLGLDLKLGSAVGALVVSREGPWRIAALAWRTDPGNLTAVGAQAIQAAMEEALSRAGWRAADVDLVKLQAENDPAEQHALNQIFSSIPRSVSFRSSIGHTLGASGPVELVLATRRPERRILFNLSGFGGQVGSMALERA